MKIEYKEKMNKNWFAYLVRIICVHYMRTLWKSSRSRYFEEGPLPVSRLTKLFEYHSICLREFVSIQKCVSGRFRLYAFFSLSII